MTDKILEYVGQHGGATFCPRTKSFYSGSGYAVGIPGAGIVVPVEKFDEALLQGWTESNQEIFGENVYIGVWVDDDTVHLDVSEVVSDLEVAILSGKQRGELAIWDFNTSTEVRI